MCVRVGVCFYREISMHTIQNNNKSCGKGIGGARVATKPIKLLCGWLMILYVAFRGYFWLYIYNITIKCAVCRVGKCYQWCQDINYDSVRLSQKSYTCGPSTCFFFSSPLHRIRNVLCKQVNSVVKVELMQTDACKSCIRYT